MSTLDRINHAPNCGYRGDCDCGLSAAQAEFEALQKERNQLWTALFNLVAEIRCDPTMDGSTRPRGLRSNIISAYDAAIAALRGKETP